MSQIILLIAEDEEQIRGSMRSYVQRHSRVFDQVLEAANGQQAIDMIIRCQPQVMLLDIQMPVKNGLEVLRETQDAGCCPRTIILSGHNDFVYAQQAIRYNVADYLLKPCRSTEMLQKLEALVQEPTTEMDAADDCGNLLVEEAKTYIAQHFHESISQADVARSLGITPAYLSSLFSQCMELGFSDYLNKVRIERACAYLVDPQMRTYEIADKVGYNDPKYFSVVFKKTTGITPTQYRARRLKSTD